jgi:uncharacterized phage-associated protein
MKLQKLVYYAQAWSLVWDDRPLFRERIEAWVNGPVVPSLYQAHRGQYDVKEWPLGNADKLDAKSLDSIDAVLDFYGSRSSQWLSDLTHAELPWREARRGLAPFERGNNEITRAAMHEFYGGLSSKS